MECRTLNPLAVTIFSVGQQETVCHSLCQTSKISSKLAIKVLVRTKQFDIRKSLLFF